MNTLEFNRLKAYSYASKYSPRTSVVSRRSSKSKKDATGQTGLKGTGKIVTQRIKYISWKG